MLIMAILSLFGVLWLIWSPVIRQRGLPEPAGAVAAAEVDLEPVA